jgi:hypothetical protein
LDLENPIKLDRYVKLMFFEKKIARFD